MRIAYVSTLKNSSWGGSEELWYQSANNAIVSGHQVGVFIYEWPIEPEQIKHLKKEGARIYKRERQISFFRRYFIKIVTKIFDRKPGWFNPYYRILQFWPDIIIVTDGSTYYTVNDDDLSAVLLHFFKNKYVIISQANSNYHLPYNRKTAIDLFENSQRVFFVSEHNRQLAFHQLAYRLSKTDTIQNPVLLDTFEIIPLPHCTQDTIHCAVVGRFCISDKGQDTIIAILNEDFWRKKNVRLHLYGKGSDRDYLEQLITFYNVADKITIEGFTENRIAIWEKCHCLIMASLQEGTPLVLLEAMVAGRVCIVTDVGGNREWVLNGVNGFLADAPTQNSLSSKMKEAFGVLEHWEFIGKAAHVSVMEKIDRYPGKTLMKKIYDSL